MKTIVIVANFCRPFNGIVDGRFLYLAEMLSKNGFKVELITSDFSHQTKMYKGTPQQSKYLSKLTYCHELSYVRHAGVKRLFSHMVWGYNVFRYLKSIEKPDIIYCAIPSLTASYLLSKYCKRKGVKFVIDVQDLWPEATYMFFKNKFVRLLFLPMKWYANKSYAAADQVIAVSQTYIDRALKINRKVNTGLSVFLGNDGAVFDAGRLKFRLNRDDDEFWICYIGTHSHSYDLRCVIDAISLLTKKGINNIRFVTVGDGPLRKSFEKYAETRGILHTFYGYKPYMEMVGIMCSADVVVNPIVAGSAASIINKVGDYALSGLPVINTQECEEYRCLIDEYQCGINCKVGDPNDIANAIELLRINPDLRFRMGKSSLKLGSEKFDRRNTYSEIMSVLQRLE